MPIEVRFGEEQFSDGVTLLPEQFYERLVKSAELPNTSQINEYAFEEKFSSLVAQGYEVVAIILSSKLSGTYSNALAAAEKFKDKVFVVDSLNASAGERLLCLYALRLAKEGQSAEQIVKELNKAREKVNFIALLDTLRYLKKGGRISAISALAGHLLSIKPVVSVIEGEVKLVGKAMGARKGALLLSELVGGKDIDFSMPYGAIYSGNDKSKIEQYISENAEIWEDRIHDGELYILGCTVGTHIGPGGIGVAFFEK